MKHLVRSLINQFVQNLPVQNPIKPVLQITKTDSHCFHGYYDQNPMNSSGKILYHEVKNKFSGMNCPPVARLLLSQNDENVKTSEEFLVESKCCNWQLGSRATWLTDRIIIYNDLNDENRQVTRLFDTIDLKIIKTHDVPFWQHSRVSELAVSLNFQRLLSKRPGYGYLGGNKYGTEEYIEIFNIYSGDVSHHFTMDDILETANLEWMAKYDPYLNHVSWSPDGESFVTLLHFSDPKTGTRKIYPLICNSESANLTLICDSGYFSHHTWINESDFLAYLELDGQKTWGIWNAVSGWRKVELNKDRDGHPTIINKNLVVLDTYPDRFGRMELSSFDLESPNSYISYGHIRNRARFQGAQRCDLHPRKIGNSKIAIDVPAKHARVMQIVEI